MNVHDATHDLMRNLELTTVFGNPGLTEETFLEDFPSDFRIVLGLQEASVLGSRTATRGRRTSPCSSPSIPRPDSAMRWATSSTRATRRRR